MEAEILDIQGHLSKYNEFIYDIYVCVSQYIYLIIYIKCIFLIYINFHPICRELVNAIIHWFLRNFSVMVIYKRIKVFLIFSRIDQRGKKMLELCISISD